MKTELISAFPGTGKSHLYRSNPHLKIMDSDSSTFPKDNFPANYIEHIKSYQGLLDLHLISSHKTVREALVANFLVFDLVFPDISLKEEYLERYRNRGNTPEFIKILESNWDKWITECHLQEYCTHVILQSGMFLSDVYPR